MSISIIIPTLNEESVLEKTLLNLKKISSFEFEIIISDGKSRDKTIEIARKHADKIVVYEEANRQTIGQARNMGAEIAKGDYLLFLDADVIVPEPDVFMKKMLVSFEQDEKLAAATVSLRVEKDKENLMDILVFNIVNLIFFFDNNIIKKGAASGEFQFIRKSYFQLAHGYNEKIVVAEDMDMFLRLSKLGKTKMIYGLTAYHTGRRAHKIGWAKLLWQWISNWFFVIILKKGALHEEWKEIR